jgi:hypothetical protein
MLDLRIPITPASIKSLKAYLVGALPRVKASHRIEAAARGLGFKTHAAMLHGARVSDCTSSAADGAPFTSYLRERGFDVEPIHLYHAVAQVAVAAVMNKVPRLSMRGYGFGRPQWDSERKRWETGQEEYAKFVEERAKLLSNHGIGQFLLALALVRRIPQTKTVRTGTGSYRLKHIAENMSFTCPDGTELGPRYVSNGALIVAALHAGFRMKTHLDHLGYDGINVTFNMSKRIVDDLDCEMRPTGGFAQDRARLAARRQHPVLWRVA